jgi:hypothetical protein
MARTLWLDEWPIAAGGLRRHVERILGRGAWVATIMVLGVSVMAAPARAHVALPVLELPPLAVPDLASLATEQIGTSAATHGPDAVDALGVLKSLELPAPRGLLPALKKARAASAPSVRDSLPATWCGSIRSTDDTAARFANGAHRYHGIYVHPADAPNRLRSVAKTLQADAFQASALLERDRGRAIRLDLGTSCGKQYLDISSVRLGETAGQLPLGAVAGQAVFDAVVRGIDAAGFKVLGRAGLANPDSYIVWFDGPGPSGTCGQGTTYADTRRDAAANVNARGGKVAMVFKLRSGDFCNSHGLRHEIGHNLGAVQSPRSVAAHCEDAQQDTMCLTSAPPVPATQGPFFDYRNDDYWDPPGAALGWWTVNLSPFLCARKTCNVAVRPKAAKKKAKAKRRGKNA